MSGAITHDDGLVRCPWPKTDPLYVAYHDTEWGVPEWDDRALFEKLILDGFQAGLSWITILRKRDNFRAAFDDFNPEKIARYTPKKVERLMQDAGIVRNRAKIEGTVNSAKAYLKIMENGPGFSAMLWDTGWWMDCRSRTKPIGRPWYFSMVSIGEFTIFVNRRILNTSRVTLASPSATR